ncbi:MAG: DUF3459 domain-containing protein [Chitinophagales bacterium]|nr:DUF3459 domain-containing protein [Chitinophagales bacterium]
MVNKSVEILNRDECRTPMLWSNLPNAGFCDKNAKPWLPIAENYPQINVETQKADANSQYNFYKKILFLRNHTPALQKGQLEIAESLCNQKVFAFYRILEGHKYLIVLNMSKSSIESPTINGEVILSTHLKTNRKSFQAYEGKVFLMND